jgi:hypothetical protein
VGVAGAGGDVVQVGAGVDRELRGDLLDAVLGVSGLGVADEPLALVGVDAVGGAGDEVGVEADLGLDVDDLEVAGGFAEGVEGAEDVVGEPGGEVATAVDDVGECVERGALGGLGACQGVLLGVLAGPVEDLLVVKVGQDVEAEVVALGEAGGDLALLPLLERVLVGNDVDVGGAGRRRASRRRRG